MPLRHCHWKLGDGVSNAVDGTGDELVRTKFEAAWEVFAATCGRFLASEATYQAWVRALFDLPVRD